MKKQKLPRTKLRNACQRTEVFFSPANYKSLKSHKSLEKDWFVQCRFFDPQFSEKYPDGFQFRKRVNYFPNLDQRKEAMLQYKKDVEHLLDFQHYNPISKSFMHSTAGELTPDLSASQALELARQKITGSASHLKQIRRCVARVNEALDQLRYSHLNISDLKLQHIRAALEVLQLPPYTFNKFRQYLSDVFKQLIEFGAVESNPIPFISKKKIAPALREIITPEQLQYIDPYLRDHYPEFYRYRMIFGYSGGRSAELFRVQLKHVNLARQEYVVQIQKGRAYVWATKVILLEAVPYWAELIAMANDPDDFIFSNGLEPGAQQISSAQITRRWKKHVKDSDKIKDHRGNVVKVTADFYTLKHLLIDQLDGLRSAEVIPLFRPAQAIAGHKSDKMTRTYATGRVDRENEYLKGVKLGGS